MGKNDSYNTARAEDFQQFNRDITAFPKDTLVQMRVDAENNAYFFRNIPEGSSLLSVDRGDVPEPFYNQMVSDLIDATRMIERWSQEPDITMSDVVRARSGALEKYRGVLNEGTRNFLLEEGNQALAMDMAERGVDDAISKLRENYDLSTITSAAFDVSDINERVNSLLNHPEVKRLDDVPVTLHGEESTEREVLRDDFLRIRFFFNKANGNANVGQNGANIKEEHAYTALENIKKTFANPAINGLFNVLLQEDIVELIEDIESMLDDMTARHTSIEAPHLLFERANEIFRA